MSSYLGRHAELYDLFYAEKPYADEAAWVDGAIATHAKPAGKRILELACGTGRHAVEFARRGYQVTACDYSADMIAQAKLRTADAPTPIEFFVADMRTIELGTTFDAVVCLFDSIGYVQTNEAIAATLAGVRRHLRLNGVFICEFWHAAAMLRNYDPTRVRRWKVPDGEVVRISSTTLDPARQLAQVAYTILDLKNDGRYERIEETQTNRYFLVQEMAGMLSQAGLTPVAWFDGFSQSEAISAETWHVLSVSRRES